MPNRRFNEATNGMRQRSKKSSVGYEEEGLLNRKGSHVPLRRHQRSKPLPSSPVTFILLLHALLFLIQIYVENYHLPQPLLLADAPSHPNEFIAERAMARLLKLTSLGPRVSCSHANEVLAVQLIKSEVEAIKLKADKSKTIEIDVQRVSGAYPLEFLDGLTNCYRNLPNVIVRLSWDPTWKHSLLINCHFDSVPDSPGGSDDGASCANMLEILQVLATSRQRLTHNIIFLFNGAEENLMHASHGFITQHPWAREVRAFVNLEACGAGGREVLFQSGPNSPWIMETYANTVPRPFASSMAQEIFASGIVPGDTDFRVFRDFGNVSGLDFAWSTNGYVYHTRFDNAEQIPLGTLQRTGENILELVKGLATAPELENPDKYRPGNLVYFDVLGMVVIRWSETVANILNVTAVLLAFIVVASNRRAFERKSANLNYYRELCKSFGVIILCSIFSSIVCFTIATFLAKIGRTMSWYGQPAWLLVLYVIPCITTTMSVQLFASKWQLKTVKSKAILLQIYNDAYLLIWTAVLILGIIFQIRSSCLAWLWVISPVIATFIQGLLKNHESEPGPGWLAVFILGQICPVLQFSGMQSSILGLFVPILGRAGRALNPDLIVGMYCTHTFAMMYSYSSALIFLEKRPGKILKVLAGVSLVSLLVLTTSNLGFPYSGNPSAPKPQRYMFVHTERIYHNFSRMETNRQGGYWIIDMDYNTPDTVKPFVPQVRSAQEVEDCEDHLYCGLPYLMPALSLVSKTHWIPGPAPQMAVPQELKLIGKEIYHGNRTMRLTFRATGPDHMGLIVSPRPGVTFEGWSISKASPVKGPKWQGRDTYFVYYASALDLNPWVFYMDFKSEDYKKPVIDVALTGHHLHGPEQRSKSFQAVLDQFPPWAALTAWTASYKSYVF